MQFIPANRDDISRYYQGSYLKFREHGETLFFIDRVDRFLITGRVGDGRDFRLWLGDEHPYTVDYILPHKSFFQYDKNAVLLERVPARQYHRGITSQNTQLRFLGPEGVVGFVELGFHSLNAFVSKQKFFTLSEAVEEKAKNSCVLNSRMMYVPRTKMIYVDFQEIARVNDSKTSITMIKPLFRYELEQFLKSTNEYHKYPIIQ